MLVYDDRGFPVDWNFENSKRSTVEQQQDEKVPEQATKEDWIDDPHAAYTKQKAYDDYISEKKRRFDEEKYRAQKDEHDRKQAFESSWNKSWDKALELYPDLKNEDSDLYKKADELFKEDPELKYISSAPLRVVKEAAYTLGLKPSNGSKQSSSNASSSTEKKPQGKSKEKMVLTRIGKTGISSNASQKSDELSSYLERQARFRT